MTDYTVHYFDEHEHVRKARRLACPTDADAVQQAILFYHPYALEVWQGERLVSRLEPDAPRQLPLDWS